MNNSSPLEIEYKYLIEMPDLNIIKGQPGFRALKLTQLYLELPGGSENFKNRCRIRKIEENGKITYVKTFKKDVSSITRVEIEDEISEKEFTELSKFICKDTAPVSKRRLTFEHKGFTCEVDVFPFWQDKAFLEIEVQNEGITPPLPDFIKVIKDVSALKEYRNSSIARAIFKGTLA